jgi:hypothetical protein
MINSGELLGRFLVTNEENKSLFFVYFYRDKIKFDDTFEAALIQHPKISIDLIKLNKKWKNDMVNFEDFDKNKNIYINYIIEKLEPYQEYLSQFFIKEQENSKKYSQNPSKFFIENLRSNNLLKELTKKEFEKQLIKEKYAEFYVEHLNKHKGELHYYSYVSPKNGKTFYLMTLDESIKIGFTNDD